MSCSRRGPLRHVCGPTIYPAAMMCTFLESQTNLGVHPGKRFALFGQIRRNWRRRNRHQKQHLLFATELFALELCFYINCISEFWHTGDNVRLSDVVKFFQGRAPQPFFNFQGGRGLNPDFWFCSFRAKSSKLALPKLAPKTTKFSRCGPDGRCSSPTDDDYFFF